MLPGAQGYFADYSEMTDRYQHTAELVSSPVEAVFQSNSWGSSRTLHYTTRSAEMDDIVWQYDIPIFQSQSNSGDQYSRPQAWAKNIISIGGVNHYNDTNPANDCWCNTASIGPAADGRIKPDLNFFYDSIFTTSVGNSYTANFGGTSGATPMVAGTAGLVLQMWADDIYGNSPPGSSVFEKRPHYTTLKAIMVNTAEQYPFVGTADDLTRVRQGWGAPNVGSVLDRAPLTRIIDESSVLRELEFDAYTATVEPGQPALRVTMVYSDRAAVPSALIHRVNDVTLRVVAPDGTEYWGNHGLLDGPWSVAGGAPDTLNTVENVFIENPQPGDWMIEVHAAEVNMDVHWETPEDDQDYSLVVYGVTALDECRSSIPVPTSVDATPTGDNQITVDWVGWRGVPGVARRGRVRPHARADRDARSASVCRHLGRRRSGPRLHGSRGGWVLLGGQCVRRSRHHRPLSSAAGVPGSPMVAGAAERQLRHRAPVERRGRSLRWQPHVQRLPLHRPGLHSRCVDPGGPVPDRVGMGRLLGFK